MKLDEKYVIFFVFHNFIFLPWIKKFSSNWLIKKQPKWLHWMSFHIKFVHVMKKVLGLEFFIKNFKVIFLLNEKKLTNWKIERLSVGKAHLDWWLLMISFSFKDFINSLLMWNVNSFYSFVRKSDLKYAQWIEWLWGC